MKYETLVVSAGQMASCLLPSRTKTGRVTFENFSRFIQQTLLGKPKNVREEIQENAALILVAGKVAARRAGERPVRETSEARGNLRLLPTEERLLQPDYEDVIAWCRALLSFRLPLTVNCTAEMQRTLIEAHIRYLAAQAAAILTDPSVWGTVEAVGTLLLESRNGEHPCHPSSEISDLLEDRLCGSVYINCCPQDSFEEWNHACRKLRVLNGT